MLKLPETLFTLLESICSEDLITELRSCQWYQNALTINIYFASEFEENIEQNWQFRFERVKNYQFIPSKDLSITIADEHPLLYPYNFLNASLYFSSSITHRKELIADLFHSHQQLVGNWFPLQHFIAHSFTELSQHP